MKRFVSILLALILFVALSVPAFAANVEATAIGEIGSYAEETEWRYRVYNGQRQMRLWSITNEVWLTDWLPYKA